MTDFSSRHATLDDLPELRAIMRLAIEQLQRGFLSDAQIEASAQVMGLDTQLIEDGTYFIIEEDGRAVGCGGWSKRRTLFGGDHSTEQRDPGLLDPHNDAARVRAMYTHPDVVRRGVGRMLLRVCEAAAAAAGFTRVELMATLSGEPLYASAGYVPVERIEVGDARVPLIRMAKTLAADGAA